MLFRTCDYFGQIIQVQISTLRFLKLIFSFIIKKTLYLQNLKKKLNKSIKILEHMKLMQNCNKLFKFCN